MSLENILAAVPGLDPRDRSKMLAAAGAAKTSDNNAKLDPHQVRAVLNKARVGHTTLVEKIIEALETAGLVAAPDET